MTDQVGHSVSPQRWSLIRARYGWKVWAGPPTEGEAYGAQEAIQVMPVAEHEAELRQRLLTAAEREALLRATDPNDRDPDVQSAREKLYDR